MRRAIKPDQPQDWLPGVAGDPTSTGSRFWGPRLRRGARTGPLFHFRHGWLEVPASGLLIILRDRIAVDILCDRISDGPFPSGRQCPPPSLPPICQSPSRLVAPLAVKKRRAAGGGSDRSGRGVMEGIRFETSFCAGVQTAHTPDLEFDSAGRARRRL